MKKYIKANYSPTTYEDYSDEYERLESAAVMLEELDDYKHEWVVGDTYFDFGQNWMWTTILYSSEWGFVQALYPADQEKILNAKSGLELADAVINIYKNMYISK